MPENQAAYDAGSASVEDAARREQERVEVQDHAVVRELLSTRDGRAWFRRLMEFCGPMTSLFYGEETHHQARAYGREEVGRKLFVDAQNASLELYLLMVREGREDEALRAAEADAEAKRARGEGDEPGALGVLGQLPDLPEPPHWTAPKTP